ncbi:MAG: DUF21 domain-containing protein, partial [Bacteroidetes bacterium]
MESDQPPLHIAGLIFSLSVQEVSLELAPFLTGATVLLVLLILSAFFSGSEVALFSLTPNEKDQLSDNTDRPSKRVVRLLENPRALLVSILILNTFVNVGAAILAAILTHDLALAMSWNPTLT